MRTPRAMAFTVVELLIVIAILSLLAALLLPSLQRAKGKVRIIECQNNLRQLHVGCIAFAGENNGFLPAVDTAGTVTGGPGGLTGVDSQGAPTASVQDIDQYFGYTKNVDYNNVGPLTPSGVYFCSEYRKRWSATSTPAAFGYAVNCNGKPGLYYGLVGASDVQATGQRYPGVRLAAIDRPAFTIYMHDNNPPVVVNRFMPGPDIWPLNRITGVLNVYYLQVSTIHMNGQNILFFDGHVEYVPWPGPAKCQIVPGYDHTTYGTYPGTSWLWP